MIRILLCFALLPTSLMAQTFTDLIRDQQQEQEEVQVQCVCPSGGSSGVQMEEAVPAVEQEQEKEEKEIKLPPGTSDYQYTDVIKWQEERYGD